MDDMKRLFDLAKKCPCPALTVIQTRLRIGCARRCATILEQHSDFKSGQLMKPSSPAQSRYRKAVAGRTKRTVESFTQLERMGAVVELSDRQLHDSASQSYVKALAQNQSVLLVAPTWAEIEAVTEKVRATLKSSGRLALDEKEFSVFDSLSWTEAQKQGPAAIPSRHGHPLSPANGWFCQR